MTQVTDEMLDTFGRSHAAAGGFRGGIQALFDAKLISLPVDEAAIRESVVRECIDALPAFVANHSDPEAIGYSDGVGECHEALQSLLPTKDRAEELAKEWAADESGAGGSELVTNGYHQVMLKQFARWLIEREG